jgi:dolichol-phosphate mannosyltransferase
VIPAYREEEYIQDTIQGIVGVFRAAKLRLEIIVVLDVIPGDETIRYIRAAKKRYREVIVIERRGKRGVGDAIRTGIRHAAGRIVIPVMGDQSETPGDIFRLTKKAANCDIVFTNRFKHGRPRGYPILKYLANRGCNLSATLLLGIPYSDTTNAFKAYKKKLLDKLVLSSNGFEIFLELPAKAMRLARKTDEVEVAHFVKKKKIPKLSVIRDGYRYARVLLMLLKTRNHELFFTNRIDTLPPMGSTCEAHQQKHEPKRHSEPNSRRASLGFKLSVCRHNNYCFPRRLGRERLAEPEDHKCSSQGNIIWK